jgi:hypothetical protein
MEGRFAWLQRVWRIVARLQRSDACRKQDLAAAKRRPKLLVIRGANEATD